MSNNVETYDILSYVSFSSNNEIVVTGNAYVAIDGVTIIWSHLCCQI